jgi:hypothetical protein
MITLRKAEQIEIYQVVIALSEKTKQSPFIAVLILAQELWDDDEYYIDAEALQEKLLTALPIRACENLLERLTIQGYFEEIWEDDEFYGYELTELGEQSATDKSFWVGEKGIFDVYVSSKLFDDGFTPYHILKIEKARALQDDRNQGSRKVNVPQSIYTYKDIVNLKLGDKEIRIEEIEDKCFQLKTLNCSLEIETKDNEGFIRIKENQTLFESSFEINEKDLKEELLINSKEFKYDKDIKAIMIEFDKNNISFVRKVKIRNPEFKNNKFNSIEIENVKFLPIDGEEAVSWFVELLVTNIFDHFKSDEEFITFAESLSKNFKPNFKVTIPSRSRFLDFIKESYDECDYFYEIAKLETIDYLNY